MSILRRRMMVPSQYRRVQFLQPNGAAYINTGYIPTVETNIEIDVLRNGDQGSIFGVRDIANKFVNAGSYFSRDTTNAGASWFSVPHRERLLYRSQGRIICQTTMRGETQQINFTNTSFSNMTLPMYLIAQNNRWNADSATFAYATLYRFKIFELVALVHDFVPALDMDGTPGLLDLVENQFYTNAGGGEFNYGELEV